MCLLQSQMIKINLTEVWGEPGCATLQIFQMWEVSLFQLLREKYRSELILGWSLIQFLRTPQSLRNRFFFSLICVYLQKCLKANEHISGKHEEHKESPSTAPLTAEESDNLLGWGLSSAAWLCLYNFNITFIHKTTLHIICLTTSSQPRALRCHAETELVVAF